MKALILQPFGVGDVIFAMGVAEHIRSQGYEITWPVQKHFVEGLQRAYPNILFKPDDEFDPAWFLIKEDKIVDDYRIIPMRWSDRIVGKESKYWMRTKYDMYGLDYKKWKEHAMWYRDKLKEAQLFYDRVLDERGYNLINRTFRSSNHKKVSIDIDNGLPNVEIEIINGYSLFDWARLIENATHIHTVNTSIFYMLELLELKAQEVHLYQRIPDEKGFPYVDYLMTKKYILH